jgi:hypothetical protein
MPSTPPIAGLLPTFNNGLELGLIDEAVLSQLFEELETQPEQLLPQQSGTLGWTAFLLNKMNQPRESLRLLSLSLRWCLQSPAGQAEIPPHIENIQYVLKKQGQPRSADEIRSAVMSGNYFID